MLINFFVDDLTAEQQRLEGLGVDGVSIAYWTLGEGTLLVEVPVIPGSHLQLLWQDPDLRRW